MNQEQARKWAKEIEWFANGGNLWWHNVSKDWTKYDNYINFVGNDQASYVIEDAFFEYRKALAQKKSIRCRKLGIYDEWENVTYSSWYSDVKSRIGPEEPVYYCRWKKLKHNRIYVSAELVPGNDEDWYKNAGWRRVEDSKRVWEDERCLE